MTAFMNLANALQLMGLLKGGVFEGAEEVLKVLRSKTASPEEKQEAKNSANSSLTRTLLDRDYLLKRHPIGLIRAMLLALDGCSPEGDNSIFWIRFEKMCERTGNHWDWYVECGEKLGQHRSESSKVKIANLKAEAADPNYPTKPKELSAYIRKVRPWGAGWKRLVVELRYLCDADETEKTFWWSLERFPLEPENGPLAFMQLLNGIKAGNESVPLYIP